MQALINQLHEQKFSTKTQQYGQLETILCQLEDHPKIKICLNLTDETTDINNINIKDEYYNGRVYNLQVCLANLTADYAKQLHDKIQNQLLYTIYHVRSLIDRIYKWRSQRLDSCESILHSIKEYQMSTKLYQLSNYEQVRLMQSLYNLSNELEYNNDRFKPILDHLFSLTIEPVSRENLRKIYFRLLDYDSDYNRVVSQYPDDYDYRPNPYRLIEAVRKLFN